MEKKFKQFKPTSFAIDNKVSIYVLVFILVVFGLKAYNDIPKEQFPEIVIPTFIVSTIYPGTSPTDIENLVTRPIEKNIKSISGVKKITSNSVQDYSSIVIEFNTGIEISDAKQKVKDAVDKTLPDLPNDLLKDPDVIEIDFAEIPIMYINVSGNYDLAKLKQYAEVLQDKIESLKEITRVDIVGALDREIQIDVDMYKMQAASVTFGDIERAVAYENKTISGGSIDMHGMTRSIRIDGEFKNIQTLENLIFHSGSGATVRLKDIATIKDQYKSQESFSRLDGKNVITLNVVKKSGQNLIEAADKIISINDKLKKEKFPKDLDIVITGDMSKYTRTSLNDLNNTILIGFILVTLVLMFFMGLTNAIFVGLSVPLSMALSYIVMPGIDFTMNMLVMFSFIFALGIVVDDAIVVIENTHRIYKKKKMNIVDSAKYAAGEVFLPILTGTLTTIAPFVPLAFWPGVVGKFMFFIPITLIIVLFASLIVAYIINPVFAVDFMKHDDDEERLYYRKRIYKIAGIIAGVGILSHIAGLPAFANLTLFIAISYLLHNLYGYKVLEKFQQKAIPAILNFYEKVIRHTLYKNRPYYYLGGLVALLIASFIITGISKPKVVFFPEGEPNSAFIYIKLPVGTDVNVTDSVTRIVENKIYNAVGDSNPLIESVISNIALGASESMFDSGIKTSNKGKITINFVEYIKRKGASTTELMDKIRLAVTDIPGAEISVTKENMGPPVGKPINIEISSEDLDKLISTSNNFIRYLDSTNIAGIEKLKSDFENNKPEIIIDIDRERANREGISSAQIGMEIRTAMFGKEISKYRDGEDQYPIQLRFNEYQRENIDRMLNLKITYRDMNSGLLRQIPLSSVAKIHYENTYGGIKRNNLKRVITISSNVLTGHTPNEVNAKIEKAIIAFPKSDDIEIITTGEKEDQAESSAFLGGAMLLSIMLILFLLISQFNSLSKPLIIISEILFSIIGVLLGFVIFDMAFSIIMTGIGIVALAGIVVRNGILLVEFTDVIKSRGKSTREAIIEAGKTRMTPVVLTAATTMLGLIPLAFGLNIDFVGLFTNFNPNIHFGGDSATFFGALSWTIIFGLSFATILTLVFIPIMYYIAYAGEIIIKKRIIRNKIRIKNDQK